MESMNLPTIPKKEFLPSDKKAISEVEEYLIQIIGDLNKLNDLQPVIEEICSDKNKVFTQIEKNINDRIEKMNIAFAQLKEKINKEIDVREYLQKELQLADKQRQVTILEQSLLTTETKINEYIDKTDSYLKSKIELLEEKINTLSTVKNEIDKDIADYNKNVQDQANSEYLILRANCEKTIRSFTSQCQQDIDILKKKSVEFIKSCQDENKELIGRIPKVNTNKYSVKDILFYVFILVTLGLQVFMFFKMR